MLPATGARGGMTAAGRAAGRSGDAVVGFVEVMPATLRTPAPTRLEDPRHARGLTTVPGVRNGPEPVERDSRGILDPWLLRRRVRLTRYPVDPDLAGLVDRFWAVQWDLPEGTVHVQQVLTHPGANLSVGCPDAYSPAAATGTVEARLHGVARGLTSRALTGRGWAVAAMTTPGGLGAFVASSAREFTDRVVPLGQAIDVDEPALLRDIPQAAEEAARVALLAERLERALRPERI